MRSERQEDESGRGGWPGYGSLERPERWYGQGGGFGRPGHEGGAHFQESHESSPGRGRFYGRAPRGYTRSDERIRGDVCDRLMQGEIDPSNISVRVDIGEVHLEGSVDSQHAKYRAEEIAESVLGVRRVDNNLRENEPGRERRSPSRAPGLKGDSGGTSRRTDPQA